MVLSKVYIALGSNLGDRAETLALAMKMLDRRSDVSVVRVSKLIETEPAGGPDGQGDYLNGAAEIETSLRPDELLAVLQDVERQLGRDRANQVRWGPRVCDLDILLMDEVVMDSPELTIPHRLMHERQFVLEPLNEIAPQAVHPVLDKTVSTILADLKRRGGR